MEENRFEQDAARELPSFDRYCGIEYTELGRERCVAGVQLRQELCNPGGIAHGGLIATLMDSAAIALSVEADGAKHMITPQNADLHFLRPAADGYLRAEARIIRKGRRICVVQTDCFSDSDSLIATGIYEICYLDAPLRPAAPDSPR